MLLRQPGPTAECALISEAIKKPLSASELITGHCSILLIEVKTSLTALGTSWLGKI